MKALKDYTKAEVKRFDEMHAFLTDYNAQVQARKRKPLDKPPYTDHEMFMYSRYRELVIERECSEAE